MIQNLLADAIHEGVPLIVLAPHLDDAALSCGALMLHAVKHTSVTVMTLFTEAGEAPYTLSARRYLKQVGAENAKSLYIQRRTEDFNALSSVGIRCMHAGLTEALFRRHDCPRPRSLCARVLPEFDHIYPIYRMHITAGRIATADVGTLQRARDLITRLTSAGESVILAPLGVGGHVDHVLVRTAAERSGAQVVYYSDFPYNQRNPLQSAFIQRNLLKEMRWVVQAGAKEQMVKAYGTQVQALFEDGLIPLVPEAYFFPTRTRGIVPDATGNVAKVHNR